MRQIDNRYLRIKSLGSGAQGEVLLCMDPKLQRKVAVKLLHESAPDTQPPQPDADAELREARLLSVLNHPNIVSVHDAGRHEGQTYLVFEYVSGQTLAGLAQRQPLPVGRSLDILTGILAGLDHAHGKALVHRDLKPANVMITDSDRPKIMDFGIAATLGEARGKAGYRSGTPRYMAPEYVRDGSVHSRADVFAVGVIAYEMLTGEVAFGAADVDGILARVLDSDLPAPSTCNPEVDERLDQWVLRATDKDPDCRYQTAGEMLEALAEARLPRLEPVDGAGEHATVEFLMRRMQHKPEFPAMARSVSRINRLVFADQRDIEELTSIIVSDVGLTSKILKVVNSAHYGAFSGKIGTISRAIIVLGTGVVRSIAASLSLLENLGDAGRRGAVRDELAASVFGGIVARELMADIDSERREDASLAALLHNLGRLLVAYYLPDEWDEVERLVTQEQMPQAHAEARVLGTRFERIGRAAAVRWNFPEPIVQAMRVMAEQPAQPPHDADERVRLVANCACEITAALIESNDGARLRKVQSRYREALGLDGDMLDGVVANCRREFLAYQTEVLGKKDKQAFLDRLGGGDTGHAGAQAPVGGRPADRPATTEIEVDMSLVQTDAEQLLSQTIQEATNLMVDDYSLSELFSVVLEGMYRSARFDRVILCLVDSRTRRLTGKMGYGESADALASGFRFQLSDGQGVFDAALGKGVDIYVEDTGRAAGDGYLPNWFRELTNAGSFLILPLVVKGRALGMIYGEFAAEDGFAHGERLLNPLKSLRNQLILGIQAKR